MTEHDGKGMDDYRAALIDLVAMNAPAGRTGSLKANAGALIQAIVEESREHGRREQVPAMLARLRVLGEEMDRLEADRDSVTYDLDRAAEKYAADNGGAKRNCSACRLEYDGVTEDSKVLVFGTNCQWCGNPQGTGIKIPAAKLENYLPKGEQG